MNQQSLLHHLAQKNGGYLQTSQVAAAGISKPVFASFLRDNHFQRLAHGIYRSDDAWDDAFFLLSLRCPQTVFSHETALFLLDLTDREPIRLTVTARTGYNPSRLTAEGVKVHTVRKDLFELGETQLQTPFGHTVSSYNAERTLCDMLRSRSTEDPQIYLDALKRYIGGKGKDIPQLMEYAEIFRIDKVLKQYLEVLLP